ncbi:MAG TPA: DUF3276 family protein [Blastocatellia bacterium]|nr:DUF3276 family protein [Blastocatellia bacterium]
MSEIFSHKVVTSRRTYFFDVKETREGAKYLVIGEVTQVGSEHERHRVMVFEESLELFLEGVDRAADFILSGTEGEFENETRDVRSGFQTDRQSSGEPNREVLRRIEDKIDDIRRHFT